MSSIQFRSDKRRLCGLTWLRRRSDCWIHRTVVWRTRWHLDQQTDWSVAASLWGGETNGKSISIDHIAWPFMDNMMVTHLSQSQQLSLFNCYFPLSQSFYPTRCWRNFRSKEKKKRQIQNRHENIDFPFLFFPPRNDCECHAIIPKEIHLRAQQLFRLSRVKLSAYGLSLLVTESQMNGFTKGTLEMPFYRSPIRKMATYLFRYSMSGETEKDRTRKNVLPLEPCQTMLYYNVTEEAHISCTYVGYVQSEEKQRTASQVERRVFLKWCAKWKEFLSIKL